MKTSKTKQILALILTLTLILTAIPLTALPAAAAFSDENGVAKPQLGTSQDKTSNWFKYYKAALKVVDADPSKYDALVAETVADMESNPDCKIPQGLQKIVESVDSDVTDSMKANAQKLINAINPPEPSTGGGFEYEVLSEADKTCKITKYTGSATNLVIPSQLDGYSVTSIGWFAFDNCTSLASVTIPDSVTSIGTYAFEDCTSLESVTIPNSVTSIGWGAFSGCTSLTNITIPDSVTSIGGYAFSDTAYYNNEANWENGVLYIGNHLIEAKSDVVSGEYQIKQGTKTIAGGAFEDCASLTSVTIPDSVKSIDDRAFMGCTALTGVTIPDSVTSIGEKALGYSYNSSTREYEKVLGFIIYGYKGSKAECYANNNGFGFVCLHKIVFNAGFAATCEADGEKDYYCCSACGEYFEDEAATKEITYLDEWKIIPAKGHTLTLHQGFAATCEAAGEKDYYTCSDCGKYFEDSTAAKEITNLAEWKVIPATGHSFGEWKTALENSCTENGIKVRICAGCGKTETQPIPAKGHSFSDWVVTTEPTCTENGTETRICVTCNGAETRPVSAKGHSFGDWIVTTEATCTENGVETRTCANCGETETKPIPAKGHSLTLHQGFAATCEAAGEKDYYVCSDCGKYFEDEAAAKEITKLDEWKVIPAAGHNWVVSADGTKRTCTVCGAEEILVIPGDVNGDGKVSAVDARWALQCAAKKRDLDEKQTKAADMNGDGKITAVDARQILKKAAGKA